MGGREQRHRAICRRGIPQDKISFVRDTYIFNSPGAPAALVDAFRNYYGPTMNAFEAAEKNGRAADLQQELEALFNSQNKSARRGRDLDSCHLPARDGRGVRSGACRGTSRKGP